MIDGPSPRVWGKRPQRRSWRTAARSIPTGVGKTGDYSSPTRVLRSIPTGVGKTLIGLASTLYKRGPSPRVWGKLVGQRCRVLSVRSIPTGVGKTPRRSRACRRFSVHPHGCGENSVDLSIFRTCVRSIPTGVGKTWDAARAAGDAAVHPHGCGENLDQPVVGVRLEGPSPRVWGKLGDAEIVAAGARSIPTGVGKTSSATPARSVSSVHPHGCGENNGYSLLAGTPAGPSPRVWGNLWRIGFFGVYQRSIPTGVGKTRSAASAVVRYSVHPHGCGENSRPSHSRAGYQGPSPRVWGKPGDSLAGGLKYRSIPTGVGKTLVRVQKPSP